MVTDRAHAYLRVIEDVVPAAWHHVERYANNRVECDHGRLKARLRPMRGLKRQRCAGVIVAGHAFVQNLRRGHYELVSVRLMVVSGVGSCELCPSFEWTSHLVPLPGHDRPAGVA